MKYKIILVLFFLSFCLSYSFCEQKKIFYISDNLHLSGIFDTQYTDMLQEKLEDFYGKGSVSIDKFSRFDINTTESFEIINSTIKSNVPKAVILMVGEANYYNLYGFSNFVSGDKKTINQGKQKTALELNQDIANIYGVKTKFLNNIVNAAYKQIINLSDGYKPKVIPEFYALEDSFIKEDNLLSTMETYNDYTDFSSEIGWNLAIAYLKDNNKKDAKIPEEKRHLSASNIAAIANIYKNEETDED